MRWIFGLMTLTQLKSSNSAVEQFLHLLLITWFLISNSSAFCSVFVAFLYPWTTVKCLHAAESSSENQYKNNNCRIIQLLRKLQSWGAWLKYNFSEMLSASMPRWLFICQPHNKTSLEKVTCLFLEEVFNIGHFAQLSLIFQSETEISPQIRSGFSYFS